MNTTLPYDEHHHETAEAGVNLRIAVDRAARVPVLAFFATAVFWLLRRRCCSSGFLWPRPRSPR